LVFLLIHYFCLFNWFCRKSSRNACVWA